MRNCVRTLVCLRLSELVIFRYLFEGSKGSICFICRYLGGSIHHHLQSILMSSWIICLTVDILMGSRFWRNGGSLVFGLDPFSNAFLANSVDSQPH